MTFKHKLSCRLALIRDALPLLAAAALVACEIPVVTSDPAVSVVQVVVVPESLSLDADQQQKFAAYGLSASGDSSAVTVTWGATGGSITSDGMFAADTAAGDFQVSATNATLNLSGSSRVRIRPRPVASVAVTPASASVVIGATVQLAATPRDANGRTLSGRLVTWGSNNAAVATVNASGLVTGVAAGAATITATSEGKSATTAVTATLAPVASVSVSPTLASIAVGERVQLTATLRDANGNGLTGRAVSWTSNTTGVATVSGSGLVTPVAAGSAIITATSEGKNGTAGITVTLTAVAVASVSVSPASAGVIAGQTVQLTATPRDASGNALSGRVVTWSSGNSAAATVSGSGLVTGVGAGSATITATSEGQSGTAAIAVSPAPAPVASVSVSPAPASVTAGQTVQLTATPRDASGNVLTGRVVTWGSSNTAVATVNGTGRVSGVAAGSATITATSESKSGTSLVTVTPVPVATVSVSPAAPSVAAGQTVQLTATPRDGSGNALAGRVVTWGSSNTAVATVNGTGLVTGVAAGSATVTATSEGMSGSAAVTVTATSGGGTVLFEERFEDNAFGSRGWYDNASPATTTAQHAPGSSTRALELHFTSGATTAVSGGSARHLFTASSTVYISYWVKYSTNWVGSGQAYHPHEIMLLSDQDGAYDGPSTSWLAAYVEHNYQNGGIPRLALQDSKAINTSFGTPPFNLSGVTENRSTCGCNGVVEPNVVTSCFSFPPWYNDKEVISPTKIAPTAWRNQWIHVEAYFQLNSVVGGIGLPDGVMQYWLNGTLMIDRHDILMRTGARPTLKFNQFLIAAYIGDGSPVDQYMWVDDLTVATARP